MCGLAAGEYQLCLLDDVWAEWAVIVCAGRGFATVRSDAHWPGGGRCVVARLLVGGRWKCQKRPRSVLDVMIEV